MAYPYRSRPICASNIWTSWNFYAFGIWNVVRYVSYEERSEKTSKSAVDGGTGFRTCPEGLN